VDDGEELVNGTDPLDPLDDWPGLPMGGGGKRCSTGAGSAGAAGLLMGLLLLGRRR